MLSIKGPFVRLHNTLFHYGCHPVTVHASLFFITHVTFCVNGFKMMSRVVGMVIRLYMTDTWRPFKGQLLVWHY